MRFRGDFAAPGVGRGVRKIQGLHEAFDTSHSAYSQPLVVFLRLELDYVARRVACP